LNKEIHYLDSAIEQEKDAFHLELSDTLEYRLLLYHRYNREKGKFERVENELIIYPIGKLPPSYSMELTTESADSVLNSWRNLPQ
jgi:hypothetical protein